MSQFVFAIIKTRCSEKIRQVLDLYLRTPQNCVSEVLMVISLED